MHQGKRTADAGEDARIATDDEIRRLCGAGDVPAAATLALRTYGSELAGFLVHALGDREAAADVFSTLAEDIWLGLPGFRWESSFRTWAYQLARRAAFRGREQERRRRVRGIPLSAIDASAIVDRVRTETLTFLRTEARTQLDKVKEELSPDERMLLSLRVDRGLSWPELVVVWAEQTGESPGDPTRAAARLRKRFQLLKDRLAARCRELGIVSRPDEP